MQKPNTIFAKKPNAPTAPGGKAAPVTDTKHAPAAHVDKHDADTNAKHAQKK